MLSFILYPLVYSGFEQKVKMKVHCLNIRHALLNFPMFESKLFDV